MDVLVIVKAMNQCCDCGIQGLQTTPQPSLQPTAAAAAAQPGQSMAEVSTATVSQWSAVTSSAEPPFNKVLQLVTASYHQFITHNT